MRAVDPRILPPSTFVIPLCHDSWHWLLGRMSGRSWQGFALVIASWVPIEKISHGPAKCCLRRLSVSFLPCWSSPFSSYSWEQLVHGRNEQILHLC